MMRYYITAASSCCRDQSLFLSGDTHIYLFTFWGKFITTVLCILVHQFTGILFGFVKKCFPQ